MEQIEKRILAKHNVKKRIDIENLGKKRRRGRVKDEKAEIIKDTFLLSRGSLNLWRNGKGGIGRQRLYALLYSLDMDEVKTLMRGENVEKDEFTIKLNVENKFFTDIEFKNKEKFEI